MNNSIKRLLIAVVILTVISYAAKAQTNVSGGIYSNTTWTKAKSPYIVTSNVVVFPGMTLTIEPGVIVNFKYKTNIEIRQAKVIANGTKNDSITFNGAGTGVSDSCTHCSTTFYFNKGNLTSECNYCNFFNSAYSIKADSIKLIIKNSNFSYNHVGISSTNSTIDSCVFRYNDYGINSINKSTIRNCSFLYNKYTGCYSEQSTISYSSFYSNDIGLDCGNGSNITNCIFSKNKTGYSSISYCKIINCIIDSNSIYGILNGSHDSIINCEIKYNGIGLYLISGGTIIENVIVNNNIGIQSWGATIVKNIIEYNGIGIKSSSAGNIYCNKICNNITYDFYNNNIGKFIISSNYWCTKDSATIASHIYDGYDNINLGLVTFLPIDTSKCYLTGCNLQITAKVTNASCDTCSNGSATASVINGLAPYIWTWYTSPLQTTQTAKGLKPGTYKVCVTDAKGCSACYNSVYVDSNNCTGFTAKACSANATCLSCADGYAWVKVQGGTKPYKYTWYSNPMQATDTAKSLTSGTYKVCVTDLYGCAACDTVTVKTGDCSAHFDIYPTNTLHVYEAVNKASGVYPLKYDWNWGDGKFDTIAYPSHSYDTTGFYKICLTIIDSAGCQNSFCNSYYLMKSKNAIIKVNVVQNSSTVISENFKDKPFNIIPNPAKDNITLTIPDNISQSFKLSIINLQGQEVKRENLNFKNPQHINISALDNGIYFVLLNGSKANYASKFIISK